MDGERVNVSGEGDGGCPLDAEVRAALQRLTGQTPFAQAPRLSKFLTYIVDETLAGRSDKVMGYTIGVDVYGKPESFDPTVDTIVRVEARRLRQRLEEYYREAGAGDPVRIVVPKGTYVPEFRYRDGDRVVTATISSANRAVPDRGPSIVVLPFDSYSADPNDAFFANGLTEETIANLARFKDLFVFSRSTSSKLAREGADIRQIHDELGADFVLESSVRKSPDAVRVTVQLVDAVNDGYILAEQFDRPCTPEGVFEIQDEIAERVALRISDRRGPLGRYVARAGRAGLSRRWETYSLIMRFYDYYATHDPDLHLEVRDGLTRALDEDPDSSDGWAALSIVVLDEYRFHINQRPSYPALDHALEYAVRAANCDPENAFAYHALAMVYFHRGDLTDFHIVADRALELNPGHADIAADIGFCYGLLGEWDESLPLVDCATELSPVHPGWFHMPRTCHYLINGDPDAALMELKTVPMPGFYWYHAVLACLLAELGAETEAAREVQELQAVYPDFAKNARDEIRIWGFQGALAEILVAGWRKAGLDIA